MARGFGSTFGIGSTDSVKAGYTAAPPTQSTFYMRIWENGHGGGSLGRIADQNNGGSGGTFGFFLDDNQNTTASTFSVAYGFSTTFGQWRFAAPSSSAWHSVITTFDGSNTSNTPIVYVDGSSVTITQVNAPSGTFGTGSANWYFGNRADGTRNWDGKLAECACWNKILTASEVQALARGVAPFFLQAASLVFYLPLLGVGSGEPDWGPSRVSQTLTGSAKVSHAPVGFWTPPVPMAPASRITGSLALAQGAAATALVLREKFVASAAALQPASTAALVQKEKFAGNLSLAAAANTASIFGIEMLAMAPGRAVVSDAAQGGLLGLADAALYDVQITESV